MVLVTRKWKEKIIPSMLVRSLDSHRVSIILKMRRNSFLDRPSKDSRTSPATVDPCWQMVSISIVTQVRYDVYGEDLLKLSHNFIPVFLPQL
ncbi:hypothetical protein ABKN59_011694 [Abortiporus biennis]